MLAESSWHTDVPQLEGWVSLREAAEILGISRQQVHNRAKSGAFKTLRKLSDASKAMFVIQRKEVEEIAANEQTA